MSEEVQIHLPKLGESILAATVVQWLKKPGERVELDEAILEVSTDKVNSEIPSPVSGILKTILADVDQEVEVGAPLATIQIQADGDQPQRSPVEKNIAAPTPQCANQSMASFFSPAVLQMAMQAGVAMQDLQQLEGSGIGGRVTKKDIEGYIQAMKTEQRPSESTPLISSSSTSSRVKMSGLRKAIAENMLRSYQEVPHAAIANEVDLTSLVKFIQNEKEAFLKAYGAKLTITSFIAKALAIAVSKHPLVNASVDKETIIVKHAVNVGIAVGVDQGVIVPVIKQCEIKDLPAIAIAIGDLSKRTREGHLRPEEVQDGTITVTNFGMAGVRIGFPIIRYPEVAIIGIGALQKRLVVLEDDLLAIRQMVDITFCFDHRVIDGLYACAFLGTLGELLQNPQALFCK